MRQYRFASCSSSRACGSFAFWRVSIFEFNRSIFWWSSVTVPCNSDLNLLWESMTWFIFWRMSPSLRSFASCSLSFCWICSSYFSTDWPNPVLWGAPSFWWFSSLPSGVCCPLRPPFEWMGGRKPDFILSLPELDVFRFSVSVAFCLTGSVPPASSSALSLL